ncbi:MAG: N-6 DNA methylase [Defluviitaleaceae bacterium]|nr:N-6 DNA methylase [Defluviitaleaceae bacterium]
MENATTEYLKTFKALYYDLYSNGNSSRAERIVSDVTRLLLCKLACEKSDLNIIEEYLIGNNSFEDKILPHIKEIYPRLFSQFNGFSFSEEAIRRSLKTLSVITLQKSPAHIIGDAFQVIIGSNLRGDKGQFFTPHSVVKSMVDIVQPEINHTIIDPACGTGGFLCEAYQFISKNHNKFNAKFIGVDKDKDMTDLTQTLMEIIDGDKSDVCNFNSLDIGNELNPLRKYINASDVILTNPPFGSKIGVTDESILSQFEFGHNWVYSQKENKWHMLDSICKSQDPQILFIELCVSLLNQNGKMAIVLPEGVFGNKTYGFVWTYLLSKGKIYSLIDCPRNTFQPSTDTKTNILFFQKSEPQPELKTWIAIAKHCGHDRRGRTINSSGKPIANDFLNIGETYTSRQTSSYWHEAILDKKYFVPRYYVVQRNSANLREVGELTTLGELTESNFLSIRSGHEVGSDAYGTGDIPFVRTSDINNLEISSDPTNSVSEEVYMKYCDQQNLSEGNILLIADGRYRIGKTAILNKHNRRCVVQSHIDIISVSSESPVFPYELLYILNLESVQEQIRSLIFIQSTLGTLGSRIKEIRIPIPHRTTDWKNKISEFQICLETRADLLLRVKAFEHSFEI